MDPRIAKTRLRLQEALFALAGERGIDNISVSDIAQRAGVNRTTFYLHYSDKETLLADALDLVAARAGAQIDGMHVVGPEPPAPLVGFLAHVGEHADLYQRVFTEPGYGVVIARLREHVSAAISRLAADPSRVPVHDAPVDFMAAGIAGAIMGMLGSWLGDTPRASPEQAARWMWEVVGGPEGRRPQVSAVRAAGP